MSRDKRRCTRFEIDLPVSFKITPKCASISLGTTIDISATGFRLCCREQLKVGHHMLIALTLPNNETLKLRVKVAWVQNAYFEAYLMSEFIMGLRIQEPLGDDERRYVKFCAQELIKREQEQKKQEKKWFGKK
ncbi:MAG: PilZ domain-containing protein [Candidatus Omnitrophica bacterium]|nr:PilZ domain-containing protein [Candidatus Omnitrophota bacterium]